MRDLSRLGVSPRGPPCAEQGFSGLSWKGGRGEEKGAPGEGGDGTLLCLH